MQKLLALLMAAAFLASCASNDGKDDQPEELSRKEQKKELNKKADLVKHARALKAKRLWSKSTGGGKGRKYLYLQPAIVADTVYVANAKGDIRALSLDKGKTKWKTKTKADISGGVGAYFGKLAVGTMDGQVITLNSETGEELWRAQTSSEILAPPAVSGSLVVVQTVDARVFAFNADSGKLNWSYDHKTPILSLRGTSGPVIDGTQVLCAFDNGQIVAFSAIDGSRTWEQRVSQPKGKTDLERIVDIDGNPVISNGLIYSASFQGNILALTQAAGKPIWGKEVSTHHPVAVGNGLVFVSGERSKLTALNAQNGSLEWEHETLRNRGAGGPAAIGRYVVVVDDDEKAHVYAQSSGEYLYRFSPPGSGFNAAPIAYLGKLYFLSNDGTLSVYSLSSR
ncbi:MAG: outer membrane protein assembly factor BamB [Agarilytica sp.]